MDIEASETSPGESDFPDDGQADAGHSDAESSSHPGRGRGILPRRSNGDRYLGGVGAGIAERVGIDAFVPRAGFLGATLFTVYAADWIPVVPIIYALLWIALPDSTGRSVLRTIRHRSSLREAAAAVTSCSVLAVMLSRPIFAVALALAALAWVLLRDDQFNSDVTPPLDQPPPESSRALDANSDEEKGLLWGQRRRSEQGEKLVGHFTRIASRPRRQPALWPLTFGLLAIIAIAMTVADAAFDGGIDPAIGVNAALIAVGAVVLLSAWRGRALWTALIALALLPAWVGFSVADVGRFGGTGSTNHRPTAMPVSGQLGYANGYGSTTIDLRDLPVGDGENLTVKVDVTAGSAKVYAPYDADVVLRSKVGFGTTEVRGNGLGFYEYDREPFLDRYMVRRYNAHGNGCIPDYWATWEHLVAQLQAEGVDLADMSPTDLDDVEPILAAITAAGFAAPTPLNPAPVNGYTDFGFPKAEVPATDRTLTQVDGYGNVLDQYGDPVEPAIEDPKGPPTAEVVWSYAADIDGRPCIERPPPDNPAIIEIDATIGVGTLEVIRDEF